MIALAISLAHWLLISIPMSVRPVNSFFPATFEMAAPERHRNPAVHKEHTAQLPIVPSAAYFLPPSFIT